MKFRFYYGMKPKLSPRDAANFSRGDYRCHQLLQTRRGQPVAIAQNSDLDIWRVQHGFSCVYFGTYNEAMDYCRDRFCVLSGDPLKC